MVLATEAMITIPLRRNSFTASEPASKSPPTKWWFFGSKLKPSASYGGSTHTVAIQKLRESKWFNQDEERLFCAVIESGFIVELKLNATSSGSDVDADSDSISGTVTPPPEPKSHYGVISIEVKKNKTPTANEIYIYTLNKCENRLKVIKLSVAELWNQDYKVRINNINDRNKKANGEKEIKSQINYAMKHKTVFHNSLHFVDFCRYGLQVELRKRQVSESVKWGTVGLNAGIFMLQREKSHSFSK